MRTATDVAFFVCSNCCSPGVMVDLARRRRPTGSTQSSLGEMILVGSADQLCGSRYQYCQIAHRAWHFGKPCGGREGFSSRPIGDPLRATLSLVGSSATTHPNKHQQPAHRNAAAITEYSLVYQNSVLSLGLWIGHFFEKYGRCIGAGKKPHVARY